ncbi:MAG: 4'-phosphopantetheinyl transferase superfamily protein [Lacrimispora sp.]|uniref:4'-phosphopantetheinyl transferase family protein n=1 Tax=Lacrimispora sp. TaxID=2719234 RepID=UPI0039E2C462
MVRIYLAQCEAAHGREKRQAEHLLGKRLLYQGLKEVYGIVPEPEDQLVILKGEHGKPYLKDFSHIHYNISHTKGLAACGLGGSSLGVDVERIRPFPESVAERVFSSAEKRRMKELPEKERDSYFFRMWTLKESYVKALGCGITVPLADISAGSDSSAFFHQEMLEGGYVLSVCTFEEEEIQIIKA